MLEMWMRDGRVGGWGRVARCFDSERNVHWDSSSLESDKSFLQDRRLESGVSNR